MVVISIGEFKDKQAEYMDRIDKGEQIIIQRGKSKAYRIMPVKTITDPDIVNGEFITADEVKKEVYEHIDKLFS